VDYSKKGLKNMTTVSEALRLCHSLRKIVSKLAEEAYGHMKEEVMDVNGIVGKECPASMLSNRGQTNTHLLLGQKWGGGKVSVALRKFFSQGCFAA